MKYEIIAIRDKAMEGFNRPFFAPALGAAIRSVTDETNRKGSEINAHPGDYDLYHLGEWHDDTGHFELFEKPKHLGNCAQLLNIELDK